MSSSQHTIQIGSVKLPTLVLGVVGSIAAHAALIVGINAVLARSAGQSVAIVAPAQPVLVRGEPIRVRVTATEPLLDSDQHTNSSPQFDAGESRPNAFLTTYATDRSPMIDTTALVQHRPREIEMRETDHVDDRDPQTKVATADAQPPQQEQVDEDAQRIAGPALGQLSPKPQPVRVDAVPPAPSSELSLPPVALAPPEQIAKADPPPQVANKTSSDLEKRESSSSAGVREAADVLSVPQPTYPQRAIRRGLEGEVVLDVQVLADGSVGTVRIHESSGHSVLDRAAIDAAKRGKFKPATRDGKPIASTILVPFEFRLR